MSHNQSPIILWFRQDLRLSDNPALSAAHERKRPIIPIYILDDINSQAWQMGSASRWWLHNSLTHLQQSLQGKLLFEKGDPETILTRLLKETGAQTVIWNRCYEPWRIHRDKTIKANLKNRDTWCTALTVHCSSNPTNYLKKMDSLTGFLHLFIKMDSWEK